MEFLAAVEASALSTWISQSTSVLAYPSILLAHTIGLTLLVGVNLVVDLRLLGFGRGIALGEIGRLFPLMWTGLGFSAASGALLFAAKATVMAVNPAFWVKLACIGCAVAVCVAIRRRLGIHEAVSSPPGGGALAAASMVLWLGAITAGRVMAYTGEAAEFGALVLGAAR
jgi:hypothetical protein